MASKPVIRTYERKRKETAEEKYDAIFGPKVVAVADTPERDVKKRRVISSDTKIKPQRSEEKIYKQKLQFSSGDEDDSGTELSSGQQSKYDVMFAENEKSASDKFDAIFAESEHIANSKRAPYRNRWLDDFTAFENEAEKNKNNSSQDSNPKEPTSPTKLPSITHASMVKVGGRLVLNIQRGGSANSLIEKGGTLLLTPEQTNNSSSDTKIIPQAVREAKKIAPTRTDPAISRTNVGVKPPSLKMLPNRTASLPARKHVAMGKKASRAKVSYNSRPWDAQLSPKESAVTLSPAKPCSQPSQSSENSVEDDVYSLESDVPELKRSGTWPKNTDAGRSLKCDKNQRKFFTVVRHVKNYQNCLEEGEIQEFEDELFYLQEGLVSSRPISVRCLSVTSLASKCEQQNFRLYLRAHNVLDKVFEELQDSNENEALALATSSLLYMLSRDRQINIDKVTLRILLKLVDPLETNIDDKSRNKAGKPSPVKTKYSKVSRQKAENSSNSGQELESVRGKIKDLIDRCGDPLVTSKDLSTKVLASEALLRYTARPTSEWYREEIRLKGGLDHVITLIKNQVDIVEQLPKEFNSKLSSQIERPLCILERLLRVLENGIVNSARNAMYLITHQRALLLKKISLLMSKCSLWLSQKLEIDTTEMSAKIKSPTRVKNVVAQIIKLLVNISNDSEWSSTRIGDQDGLLSGILQNIIQVPTHMNEDDRYEIMLLSLGLLVNLVESSAKNRMAIMQMKVSSSTSCRNDHGNAPHPTLTVVEALVQLFIDREIAAKQNEILGEEGAKKAAEAKRQQVKKNGDSVDANQSATGLDADSEGYWVENDDGMEWVPVPSLGSEGNDLPSSQGSYKSFSGDPQNIEAKLTPEEKEEMREALEKANDHMEASIIASYTALVLGCLMHGNRMNANTIRASLPNNGELSAMIAMLKKFLSFMNLTHGMSKKGEQKLIQVIEDMEEINVKKYQPPH